MLKTPFIEENGTIGLRDTEMVYDSHLQGYVTVSYADLIKTFGEPNDTGDDYKTDAQWFFMTDYGAVSIYNYKDGKNYNGETGTDVADITDWHIGGLLPTVVDIIEKALVENKKIEYVSTRLG